MPELLPFLLASLAITIAPGPDNLQVLARGIAQGRHAGLAAAAGFASGTGFHTMLAAVGVAAALRASPTAFTVIRMLGAAYLLWIGIQALRSRGGAQAVARPPLPLHRIYGQSVLAAALNPKLTLFFVVFLPQFARPAGGLPLTAQLFVLGAVFMAQAFVVFAAIGVSAAAVGDWLKQRPRAGIWLDRLSGAIFVALGLRVAIGG